MSLTEIRIGSPTDVCVEASWEGIHEADLNWREGEHFDWIKNVISITNDTTACTVTFETCRSIEAWKRGEPNAGRGVLEIEHRFLQCVYIDGSPVWGRPGNDL